MKVDLKKFYTEEMKSMLSNVSTVLTTGVYPKYADVSRVRREIHEIAAIPLSMIFGSRWYCFKESVKLRFGKRRKVVSVKEGLMEGNRRAMEAGLQ